MTFVKFEEIPVTTKTRQWLILTKKREVPLGVIKWWYSWRTYAFFPLEETIFSPDCLDVISGFIREQMEARK